MALQGAPSSRSGDQILALQYLKDNITNWAVDTAPKNLTAPKHSEKYKWDDHLPPRVQPSVPRVKKPSNTEMPQAPRVLVPRPSMPVQLVAHRTRDRHKPAPPAALPNVPPMEPSTVLEHLVAHRTQS